MQTPDRLINKTEVFHLTSLKQSFVYALMARDEFPRPIKIGKRSAWSYNQICDWIQDRIANPVRPGRPSKLAGV